ncbi:hypothetical protein EJ05DRAFT_478764 [Pseudovirgaria hyperparasitica]|uniref:Thioredoxin domain-containing protein n=1 Tax=Pseudovirgaria hyperparasitica TaxID=470096 RepID=A0A6A6VZT8_9PEZI|nr:uncharacterized protein EJ05DRAFT_478764 [Pseudovirgaria hyperparasitica]KAF2755803.1 hypothetical protein EJ05DRAFT_478764 [Pseudovirgaria hyperparasitica]
MTFTQELKSWLSPKRLIVSDTPEIGRPAPSTAKMKIPCEDGKPTVVVFLRHCGCPFAEKTYLSMRTSASAHPSYTFVAVSHSDQPSTDNWLRAILQSQGDAEASNLKLIIDDTRDLYARWGLGISSLWHVLNPTTFSTLSTLKKTEGIDVRSTESGSRWQTAGAWAVDSEGIIRWGRPARSADEIPDMAAAVGALSRE